MELYIAAHVALQASRELDLKQALSLPPPSADAVDVVMARYKTERVFRKATVLKKRLAGDGEGIFDVSYSSLFLSCTCLLVCFSLALFDHLIFFSVQLEFEDNHKSEVTRKDVRQCTLKEIIDHLTRREDVQRETNTNDDDIDIVNTFVTNLDVQLRCVAWAVGIPDAEELLKQASKNSSSASAVSAGTDLTKDAEHRKLLTNTEYLPKRRKLHGSKLLSLLSYLSSSSETSAAIEQLRSKMSLSSADDDSIHAEFWLWPNFMQLFHQVRIRLYFPEFLLYSSLFHNTR
jgi:hypothetical protein